MAVNLDCEDHLDCFLPEILDRQSKRLHHAIRLFDTESSGLSKEEDLLYQKKEDLEETLTRFDSNQSVWSTAKRILDYTQSTYMVFAASTVGMTTPMGMVFLAAGGIGLGTRLVQDITGWKPIADQLTQTEEDSKQLTSSLEKYGNWLCLGVNGAASIIGKSCLPNIKNVYTKTTAFITLMQGVIDVKCQYIQNQLAYTQAKKEEINVEINHLNEEQTQLASEFSQEMRRRQELSNLAQDFM